MKQFDTKELERIISLFLDGELEPDEARKFEEFLENNPSVAREFKILNAAKRSLSAKEKLPANDWFWLRLSNTIESKESRKAKLIPTARPQLALTMAALFTVAVIAAVYFKDAPLFHKFFVDKKNQVQNSLMTGNILPLFSNLDKVDVLNFALFGSIQIDSANNTSLRVKNTEDKGSQIEIVRREHDDIIPVVSVSDFCEKVGIIKPQQQLTVDSILGTYKEKLLASVLVSENKEIAIHEQLVDLNRAMVSTIAASLEPRQRTKFQRILEEHQAPFAVFALNVPKVESQLLLRNIPRMSRSNKYVVISKDTVSIAEMKMNIDSIRDVAYRQRSMAHRIAMEQMVREISELQRQFENNVVISGTQSSRVRVFSNENAFRINLEAPAAIAPEFEMVEMVRPRVYAPSIPKRGFKGGVTVIGDSAFSFEIPADDEAVRVFKRLPRGEFRFEIVDSIERSPKMKIMFKSTPSKREFESKLREMRERERELIDLDSLLRESERTLNSEKPTPPKKTPKVFDL
ncbi:MAG: hypothetical protein HYV29_01315 [Ignavibacteriales bacterium]|nr:hypothetical protein [Ignavibacteriales bacterium]